jgi:hypothetical protein
MRKPISVRLIGIGLVLCNLLLATFASITFVKSVDGIWGGRWVELVGVASSQACLIGLWAGMSNSAIRIRIASAIVSGSLLCTVFAWVARATWPGGGFVFWWPTVSQFTLFPLAAIAIFGAALKRRGFAVEQIDNVQVDGNNRDIQFSLLDLFALLLLMAVLLAVVREMETHSRRAEIATPFSSLRASFYAFLFALHLPACLWATLATGRLLVPLGAALFSAAFGAGIYRFAFGGSQFEFIRGIELMAVHSVVTGASLWALRMFGFRLMRRVAHASASRHA